MDQQIIRKNHDRPMLKIIKATFHVRSPVANQPHCKQSCETNKTVNASLYSVLLLLNLCYLRFCLTTYKGITSYLVLMAPQENTEAVLSEV
jgi:hypothetical protein